MSVSVDMGKGARRKSVSAELNLVPYIDLLTCMVSFLLITAVWTQLATLKVQQHAPGTGEATSIVDEFKIVVLVQKEGFVLVRKDHAGGGSQPISGSGGTLDYAQLTRELRKLKGQHPDKSDVQVTSEDSIRFEELVKTMDAVMVSGFPDVSLLDDSSGG